MPRLVYDSCYSCSCFVWLCLHDGASHLLMLSWSVCVPWINKLCGQSPDYCFGCHFLPALVSPNTDFTITLEPHSIVLSRPWKLLLYIPQEPWQLSQAKPLASSLMHPPTVQPGNVWVLFYPALPSHSACQVLSDVTHINNALLFLTRSVIRDVPPACQAVLDS